jgi:hypothetical protein
MYLLIVLSYYKDISYVISRADCKNQVANYANALRSFDNIIKNYDSRNIPRPLGGNGNVTVTASVFIRSIHNIDEQNQVKEDYVFVKTAPMYQNKNNT